MLPAIAVNMVPWYPTGAYFDVSGDDACKINAVYSVFYKNICIKNNYDFNNNNLNCFKRGTNDRGSAIIMEYCCYTK